jgi:hypothetical protein
MATDPKPRKKRQREYRLSDVQAMVEQLGGRLHLSIVPRELIVPKSMYEPKPSEQPPARQRPKTGAKQR